MPSGSLGRQLDLAALSLGSARASFAPGLFQLFLEAADLFGVAGLQRVEALLRLESQASGQVGDEGHQLFADRSLGHAGATFVGLDFLQMAKDRRLRPGVSQFDADGVDRRVPARLDQRKPGPLDLALRHACSCHVSRQFRMYYVLSVLRTAIDASRLQEQPIPEKS